MRIPRSLFLPLLAVAASSARAQGVLYTWPAPPDGGFLGSVASAGDVDGDGVHDFARTERPWDPNAFGTLRVHSGADGSELFAVTASGPGDGGFGARVCGLGSVDLDQSSDLAVSAGSYVRCVSGSGGATLWQTPSIPVTALHSMDDLDGDGAREVVVGTVSTAVGVLGQVRVLSGRTGALLRNLAPPPSATKEFGRAAVGAGDFDLDGVPDILVGDPAGGTGTGRVSVHSGAVGGGLLATFDGPANPYFPAIYFGYSVAAVGDVDGDGWVDLFVGSPSECLAPPGYEGCVSGRARLLSGASGAVLHTFTQSTAFSGFGVLVAGFPDLDGDGLMDLFVSSGTGRAGCCHYFAGEAQIFSSSSGALLYSSGYGHASDSMAVVPDVTGDGVAEYLSSPVFSNKSVLALPFVAPPLPVPTCIAKVNSQNCAAILSYEGAPSLTLGDDLTVRAHGAIPGSVGFLCWGPQIATTPFAGGMLCVGPPLRRSPAMATGGTTQCAGSFQFRFTKSLLASLGYTPGSVFVTQGWYRDPGFAPPNDVGLTRSLAVTIWP